MDAVRIEVAGERQAGLRFEQFPDVLYEDLRNEIESLTSELFGRVRAATPSASGKMRSQERMRIFTDKDRITGYIDVNGEKSGDHAKAAALEYGAHKSFKVDPYRMRLDHFWAEKLERPVTVMVDAFTRRPNIPEHRFLRGPLDAMRGEVSERLNAVVEKGIAEANA